MLLPPPVSLLHSFENEGEPGIQVLVAPECDVNILSHCKGLQSSCVPCLVLHCSVTCDMFASLRDNATPRCHSAPVDGG